MIYLYVNFWFDVEGKYENRFICRLIFYKIVFVFWMFYRLYILFLVIYWKLKIE